MLLVLLLSISRVRFATQLLVALSSQIAAVFIRASLSLDLPSELPAETGQLFAAYSLKLAIQMAGQLQHSSARTSIIGSHLFAFHFLYCCCRCSTSDHLLVVGRITSPMPTAPRQADRKIENERERWRDSEVDQQVAKRAS